MYQDYELIEIYRIQGKIIKLMSIEHYANFK